ncbi:MAG: hypothetical protein V4669_13895 [Pseudomonadota bacterium]
MRKLYLTHNPAELVMAFLQAQGCMFALYLAFTATATPWIFRWFLGEIGLIAGVLCYVFLFTMSGSRERRKSTKEAVQ